MSVPDMRVQAAQQGGFFVPASTEPHRRHGTGKDNR
jgi:hypothetical protein